MPAPRSPAPHGARLLEAAWELEGARRNAGIAACTGDWILEVDADERVLAALAAEIRAVIASSAHGWHLVRIDNYVGERLVLHGWGGCFGRSAHAGLFRRGAKHWRRPAGASRRSTWTGHRGRAAHRPASGAPGGPRHLRHAAPAGPLYQRREAHGSAGDAARSAGCPTMCGGCVSRFLKCYVGRRGYREGGWGFLIALCAGLLSDAVVSEGAAGAGGPAGRPARGD